MILNYSFIYEIKTNICRVNIGELILLKIEDIIEVNNKILQ